MCRDHRRSFRQLREPRPRGSLGAHTAKHRRPVDVSRIALNGRRPAPRKTQTSHGALWHHWGRMERRPSRAPAAVRSRWPSGRPGQADESPTVVKRDSGVLAPGNLIDVVPKITVDVKHECDHEPRRILHQGEVCRIGTHSSNDVVLRDPAVSRFHCKLTYEGGVWRLQDSGSLNGTTLD